MAFEGLCSKQSHIVITDGNSEGRETKETKASFCEFQSNPLWSWVLYKMIWKLWKGIQGLSLNKALKYTVFHEPGPVPWQFLRNSLHILLSVLCISREIYTHRHICIFPYVFLSHDGTVWVHILSQFFFLFLFLIFHFLFWVILILWTVAEFKVPFNIQYL